MTIIPGGDIPGTFAEQDKTHAASIGATNMNRRLSFRLTTVLTSAVSVFGATALANGQQSSVWNLNTAKSKYSPGPGPKELTETTVLSRERYTVDGDGIAADGKQMHFHLDAKFDGKDYPLIGVAWADTLSAKWIDAETAQLIEKRNSQITMLITCATSRDGKARTCTLKGTDEQGRRVNSVAVFDRK
jgi:hypothetical protein